MARIATKSTITLTTVDGRRVTRLVDDIAVDPTTPDSQHHPYMLDGQVRMPTHGQPIPVTFVYPAALAFRNIQF